MVGKYRYLACLSVAGFDPVLMEYGIMPNILAYHPEIHVEVGDKIWTLLPNCKDWAPEHEILKDLAKSLEVTTVGEVAEHLQRQGLVRIESSANFYLQSDRDLWEWDREL